MKIRSKSMKFVLSQANTIFKNSFYSNVGINFCLNVDLQKTYFNDFLDFWTESLPQIQNLDPEYPIVFDCVRYSILVVFSLFRNA